MKIDPKSVVQLITQTQSNFNSLNLAILGNDLLHIIVSTIIFLACLVFGVSNSIAAETPDDGKVFYYSENGEKLLCTNISFEAEW